MARVRALREAIGLSQEAFAERAGLTYKHYQQVESGRKFDIRLSTLIKMAEGLGLELCEMVDLNATPLAVGEDPPEDGFKPIPGKGTRKPSSRRTTS